MALAAAGAQWVQLDEPRWSTDIPPDDPARAERVYTRAGRRDADRPQLSSPPTSATSAPRCRRSPRTPVEAIGIDLVARRRPGSPRCRDWPTRRAGRRRRRRPQHLAHRPRGGAGHARAPCASRAGAGRGRRTSCSLLHVPLLRSTPRPTSTPRCAAGSRSATEKVAEVVTLASALTRRTRRRRRRARAPDAAPSPPADDPAPARRRRPGPHRRSTGGGRPPRAAAERAPPGGRACTCRRCRRRLSAPSRRPPRSAPRAPRSRGRDRRGRVRAAMRGRDRRRRRAAGEFGLDVLVHGEPERNDMVQYFAEQLDGFVVTATAGCSPTAAAACAPPILYGDVSPTGADDRRAGSPTLNR